jgi:hypothetical protein
MRIARKTALNCTRVVKLQQNLMKFHPGVMRLSMVTVDLVEIATVIANIYPLP